MLVVGCQPDQTKFVAPTVRTEDLVDALGVAEILGLTQRTSVSVYQHRYPDMPRPVVDLGRGRPKLWLRSAIVAWAKRTGRLGTTR
jgi:hypothetical protein